MKHTITLFIADRRVNDFMAGFDLRSEHKWFIRPVVSTIETSTPLTDDYFTGLIEQSKQEVDFWVPAIKYMDNFYCDPDVKILSDGQHEVFIPR